MQHRRQPPAKANIDVGATFPNSGVDTLNVPLAENTPQTGVVTGGTLDVTNTSALAPNAFVATDLFTVNTGATLEFAADPTNPALGAAAINLNGGTLQIDSSASGSSALANTVTDVAAASSTIKTTGSNAVILSSATSFAGNGTLTVTSTGTSSLTLSTLALPTTGPATDTLTQNASTALTVNAVTDDGARR